MRKPVVATFLTGLAMSMLAACQVADDKQSEQPAPDQPAQGPTVTETATAEPPAPMVVKQEQPAPTIPVITTQPGPDGSTVELNKVAVTGEVLTVQVTVKPAVNEGVSLYMKSDEVSVIDDATSQRYSLLKDNAGKAMASPISSSDRIGGYTGKGKSTVYWFKFPAPPAGSATVSINLPDVAPFDGMTVTR